MSKFRPAVINFALCRRVVCIILVCSNFDNLDQETPLEIAGDRGPSAEVPTEDPL